MDLIKNNNYDSYENLNSSSYRMDEFVSEQKEKYIADYCTSKGWDKSNLNIEQLTEIHNSDTFKNIGKLNG